MRIRKNAMQLHWMVFGVGGPMENGKSNTLLVSR
jgi:hypothetical protein